MAQHVSTSSKQRIQPTAFGWPYTLSPHDSGLIIEDVWPTLFFGGERLPEIKRKLDQLNWARAAVEQMKAEAETILAKKPQVPIERIGWRHDFYSHDTAEHLLYAPDSPDRYFDPWDGSQHSSAAQHRAWALLTHERTFRLMRSLSLLYGLTGEEKYATWVADGMRAAVEMFSRGDLRQGNRTGALYFQPLYDAQILLLLANSFGLTRDSEAYSEADRANILAGIFASAIPYQRRFFEQTGAHNMACYVAAALVTVGALVGREDWVEMALDDDRAGLAALLKNGLREDADGTPDGFWFEGTMFYHFYSLCPLVTLWEASKTRFDDSLGRLLASRFETLFSAPVKLADSKLRLPTIGDLGAPKVMSLALYRHLYEYAAGQLDAEKYFPLLGNIYANHTTRNSLAALAYGPDSLPEATDNPNSCATVLCAHGIAVFRAQHQGEDFQVLLIAGPHGAGHSHCDKLHVSLTARGECLATDLGTAGYAVRDIHGYYRSTLSHNTLLVDEKDQKPVKNAHLEFQPNATPAYARARLKDAYESVQLTREVFFDPPYLALVDRCESEVNHRYGWIFHAYGSMSAGVSAEIVPLDFPPLSEDGVFAHLTNRTTHYTDGFLTADWRVTDRIWLRLVVTADQDMEVTLGRTPGNPRPDDRGTVFLRTAGTKQRFLAAFEVHSGAPTLQGISTSSDGRHFFETTTGANIFTLDATQIIM